MKSKKLLLAITSVIICLSTLLSACGKAVDVYTPPAETDSPFGEDPVTDAPELSADEIVYPEGELPKVYITTDDGKQVTSKNVYSTCNIRFEMNEVFEEYQNTYTDENGGAASIRCRGNMTYNIADARKWNMYSYKLKLETKADFFGYGESKHWYLVNSWRDISYLRHKLSYDLAASLGIEYTDCTWVSLYYNGEYRGLYLMTESIRIADDRIEMTNWEEFGEDVGDAYAKDNGLTAEETALLLDVMEHNLNWLTSTKLTVNFPSGRRTVDLSPYFDPEELDFSTGYLIEICNGMDTDGAKWKTDAGFFIVLDSPMYLHTNSTMFQYVKTLIQDFEDAIMSPTFFNDKGHHYSEYIDIDSMVDYWLIWNYFVNTEFGARSMYFHIKDGKMVFGPIWDFDGTSGNIMSTTKTGGAYNRWINDRSSTWFKNAFRDPWFTALAQERWYSIRELLDDFMDSMDIYARYIKEGAEQCYGRTGPRTEIVRQPDVNNGVSFTPWEDYEYLHDWFENRIEWIDENFATQAPNVDKAGYERSAKLFFDLKLNGTTLEADNTVVYGAPADYIMPSTATGELKLDLSTTHSGVTYVDAYLNGTKLLGSFPVSAAKSGSIPLDISSIDLTDGAVNTIYLMAMRDNGTMRSMSSVIIRISDKGNPEKDECILRIGDSVEYVKKGSTISLPEIEETRDGFIALGWTTTGKTVHEPGKSLAINKDTYFFIKWKRVDMNSRMDFSPEQ
ncbi:MAG: CotH kinase family protein [Clostridia bacterium]|nr:CotH kinase family protein [Clostridia bacterium]